MEHARQMVRDGVDIIDVGGQSTRPHAARLPPEVELQRVMPVIGCSAHSACYASKTRSCVFPLTLNSDF